MSETEEPVEAATARPEGADYTSDLDFADFPVREETLRGIAELGFQTATPVQARTIHPALAGKDMIVRAKTGTGKTAAFGVPIVELTPDKHRKPFAVVLEPTRELAQQTAEQMEGLAKYRDLAIALIVGGVAMGPQEKSFAEGAEILVATPGRLLDHLRRGNVDLSGVKVICLDEADEMLSMGFFEDVTTILDATPKDRQVLLFSATISQDTQRIVQRYLKDPVDVMLSTDTEGVELLTHVYYETSPDLHRARALLHILDLEDPQSAIIFCNTREDTATVATFLDRQGLDAQLISGELSQARRTAVMQKVKSGEVRFLVATDVAARGIDISDLSHVVNYSLPQDPAVYLHRTGRTGRIGKKGIAISLVGGPDLGTRRQLESRHHIKFEQRYLPSPDEAVRTRVERQAAAIKAAMGTLVFESYMPTVDALMQRPDGKMLLAAALRVFFQWDRERRAVASELSTVDAVLEARAAKAEREEARGGRGGRDGGGRGGRDGGRERRDDRGERRDDRRDDRREEAPRATRRPEPRKAAPVDHGDLDALLSHDEPEVADEAEDADDTGGESGDAGDAERKKRRKRRKKKRTGEGGAVAASSDASPAPAHTAEDLDALLDFE